MPPRACRPRKKRTLAAPGVAVIHPRQVHAEAFPGCRLHRRVEAGPLVGASHRVGRTESLGTVAPPTPVDEPKACLVEGQDLQRLPAMARSASPEDVREVFLKASCSSGSAFSCRGRPVLSFTLRRLKS